MTRKKVRLKDIAECVGVSVGAVSRILNNAEGVRISEDVADKIRDAAAEMGYRGNFVGSALRTGQTNLIGLVISNTSLLTSPGFLQGICQGVMAEAVDTDYSTVLLPLEPRKKAEDIARNGLLDGALVLSPGAGEPLLKDFHKLRLPTVIVNGQPDCGIDSFVLNDYENAAAEAVDALVKQGHKKIALVAYNADRGSNALLIKGFKKRCRELANQGVKCKHFGFVVDRDDSFDRVAAEVAEGADYDAFIVDISKLAQILCDKLAERGKKIGDKRDLIVFSTDAVSSAMCSPWLTYEHRNVEMGRAALKMVIDQIEDGKVGKGEQYIQFKKIYA